MLNDTYGVSQWCTSHKGGFSFFFDVGDTQSSFWDWVGKDTYTIDLNQVFSKTSPMDTQILGYMGTETEPNCMDKFCWYMNLPAGTITQATLDMLKVKDVEFNNRATGQGGSSIYKMKYDGLFYTEPTDPDAGPTADEL